MTDAQYRELARRTRANAAYRPLEVKLGHWTTGLAGEAGEIANDVKKTIYTGKFTVEQLRHKVKDEAGDVLWYLDALLDDLGITLEEVKEYNIQKLAVRYDVREEVQVVS